MPQVILRSDWSDYDNRKIRDGRDRNKFSCNETWEVDYLVQKINHNYSQYSTAIIRSAISYCCTYTSNRERDAFVSCVMARLRA